MMLILKIDLLIWDYFIFAVFTNFEEFFKNSNFRFITHKAYPESGFGTHQNVCPPLNQTK
jgi:hypothetical protein